MKRTLFAGLLASVVSVSAVAGDMMKKDIVDTAAGAGTFKTLLTAADAAGLVDALRGEGPLTVFAPTDDAFAALPEGTVENLLKPENKDQLQAVLTYHVVPGKVIAETVASGNLRKATSLQGDTIDISIENGLMVDGANIIATDIEASNGVIHVIDSVILPN